MTCEEIDCEINHLLETTIFGEYLMAVSENNLNLADTIFFRTKNTEEHGMVGEYHSFLKIIISLFTNSIECIEYFNKLKEINYNLFLAFYQTGLIADTISSLHQKKNNKPT